MRLVQRKLKWCMCVQIMATRRSRSRSPRKPSSTGTTKTRPRSRSRSRSYSRSPSPVKSPTPTPTASTNPSTISAPTVSAPTTSTNTLPRPILDPQTQALAHGLGVGDQTPRFFGNIMMIGGVHTRVHNVSIPESGTFRLDPAPPPPQAPPAITIIGGWYSQILHISEIPEGANIQINQEGANIQIN